MAKGDIISRLKLESGEFDSKIKRAGQELMAYSEHCRKTGLEMGYANKDAKDFAKSLGSMTTTATTARGKVNELSDAFVNLKSMYNQMTDAEKQGQFGKNLAASLDQLKQRTQQAKQELADITKELNGASNIGGGGGLFSSDKLSGMLQVFGGNLMTKGVELATSAVTGLINETGEMIRQGVELAKQGEGIRIAFQRLGRGDILDGLREATHGTVTDLELMKAAVKFNDFKLPVEELGTMLAFAQQKAKDTGQSVDYMVDSIVTGLGRKSLMILDNLGLSANEVKEKMKETGDMTKAVGEIIREQMAKAGDYVETAADRALRANVNLQNKMEELGRKFAPIEEASNQLWTSMKIGILDIIGGPLAQLLNGLTEAGRLKNQLNNMNGGVNGQPTKVDRQIAMLGNGQSPNATRTYNRQIASYNKIEQKAWQEANRNRDEINRLRQQIRKDPTQSSDLLPLINDLTRKLERAENKAKAVQTMRSEYQARANNLFNPTSTNTNTTTTTTTTTSGGGRKTTTDTTKNLEEMLNSSFEKLQGDLDFSTIKDEIVNNIFNPFEEWSKTFREEYRKNNPEMDEELRNATRKSMKDREKEVGNKGKGRGKDKDTSNEVLEKFVKNIDKITAPMDYMSSGISSIVSGLEQLGIEIPEEIKNVIGVVQAISSILSGISLTVLAILATSSVPFFANGGLIGRAAGGITVPGNRYSGDNLRLPVRGGGMIGVNSGELILNRAQQGVLADALSSEGMGAMQLTATIRGEQIRLALNNNGRRTGRGETITTNRR